MFGIITNKGINAVGGYFKETIRFENEELNIFDFSFDSYDFEYLDCYVLGENELILDETKKAEKIAKKEDDEKKKKHTADINEQTTRLAQMFLDMGVNADDFLDRLDAQSLYTALMTDSLLPEEEE